MASKSRSRPQRKRQPNQLADDMMMTLHSGVDESTLESELEALLSGKAPSRPTRPKRKNELQKITAVAPPERRQSPESNNAVTSVSVMLQERLSMYNEAIRAAKLSGDSAKVRRYGRGVKTIEGLIKSANSGASINEEDIPPVVKIPKIEKSGNISNEPAVADLIDNSATENSTKIDSPNVKEHSSTSSKAQLTRSDLIARRDQYKVASLQAKREGNKELALNYLRTVKTFNSVIEAMENNQPVDLSNVPPPPKGFSELSVVTVKDNSPKVTHDEMQASSEIEKAAFAAANEPAAPELFAAPPPPSTILEALQQRLEKYTVTKQAAEAENNSGKARRLQRIIKQYETAIKDFNAGRNVNFEELPTPPGFAPIPVSNVNTSQVKSVEKSAGKPVKEQNTAPHNASNKSPGQTVTANSNAVATKKPKIQRTNTSTVGEKQLEFLLKRQKLFRQAALTAKQNGDIQQATEYLRMRFDSMIEATKCGLPIDASTIPTPPQLESDFVIVDVSECVENENCNQEELYENLEKDLFNQIEICTRNKEHFLRLGDVSSASKFEKNYT
ncbi:coiled-coil and C2 domain-containing protein 1-like [Caerostris extrusa]|uniref:Coiled-coil and C2 domain-containing protein 1-like n=1 Tax=Caerostris extrusa TaxID=172846 RepID=A0AAV4MFL3_CAEEX|nr:coiled-coil and C2 domain-containing protein 1-like [Caerostris extrusa]